VIQRLTGSLRGVVDLTARGASLIVTDRRWGVTMSAAALGFGLFVGVAIGPGASGTFATGPQQLIELPSLVADDGGDEEELETGGSSPVPAAPSSPLAVGGESSSLEAFPSAAPLTSEASESPPADEEPASEPKPTAGEEPEEVETTELVGAVVHANPAAGSYTLATKGGELVPVHAAKLPQPGIKVSIEARQLANGTFAEEGTRKREGKATKATFRGVVTHLDPTPAAPAYTLSGRGASIVVHLRPDPTGAAPQLPVIGTYATATVDIEKPQPPAPVAEPPAEPTPEAVPAPTCVPDPTLPAAVGPASVVWQRQLKVEGEPAAYIDLAGVVTAVCPDTAQLLISADDTRESAEHLTLAIPTKIDASKLELGDSVLATAELAEDGTLTLAGLASDDQIKGADDEALAQGDLKR